MKSLNHRSTSPKWVEALSEVTRNRPAHFLEIGRKEADVLAVEVFQYQYYPERMINTWVRKKRRSHTTHQSIKGLPR
jgi:hypothetical protein